MKPGKSCLSLTLFTAMASTLAAQGIDTTGLGYRIGYQVGSWLPSSIIMLVAVLLILKSSRQYRDK